MIRLPLANAVQVNENNWRYPFVLDLSYNGIGEEGVAALFKGAAERVMRSSPQFGAACVCVVAHVCMPWRTRSYEVLSFDQTGVTLCAFSALKDASIERGWL